MDPADLDDNPANWRRHPEKQTGALTAALEQVGWAGALLYNEQTKHLIDGHARKKVSLSKAGKVPVLIGSWTEEQEKLILATLDPLAAMAEADTAAMDKLLREVSTGNDPQLDAMLAELAVNQGIVPAPDPDKPEDHWQGMPEFQHEDKTAFQSLTVHFKDQAAVDRFAEIVGQKLTPQTRFLWFPKIEIESYADKRYANAT